jgi:hypothetical protein
MPCPGPLPYPCVRERCEALDRLLSQQRPRSDDLLLSAEHFVPPGLRLGFLPFRPRGLGLAYLLNGALDRRPVRRTS